MNDEVQDARASARVHHSSLALRTALRWALLGLILLFVACETVEVRFARTLRGDETLYIQAAYTMMETGDWLTPRFETGELRFNKPILPYWVVGIPMSLFGLSLSAARLPSVALALAALPFVYGLARVLMRDRAGGAFRGRGVPDDGGGLQQRAPGADGQPADVLRRRRDVLLRAADFRGGPTPRRAARLRPDRLRADHQGHGRDRLHPAADGRVPGDLAGKRSAAGRWRALASPWGWALLLLITVPWYAVTYLRYRGVFTNMFFEDQVTENLHGSRSGTSSGTSSSTCGCSSRTACRGACRRRWR